MISWLRFVFVVQALVVLGALVWFFAGLSYRPRGWTWAAPPVGLVLGMGLPLQVVISAIIRAGRA
jgi:hypothetical protein